jgi:WD40 repeat protein
VIDKLLATITDTASGKQLLQFKLAEGTPAPAPIGASSLSPDGTRLATIGPGNTAKIWDLANSGSEILTLEGHSAPVMTVMFSPDGKSLATASQDNSVKLWNVETGRELYTLLGHTHFVGRVVFSPDGTRLASGSFDSTAKVWDTRTGKELFTLSGAGASVWAIAFSPDGQLIATGNNDETLRLWDAKTGKLLLTLPIEAISFQVSFTPDSSRIVLSTLFAGTRVYLPQIEDLFALAKSRVTRTFTPGECREYLHLEQCPP